MGRGGVRWQDIDGSGWIWTFNPWKVEAQLRCVPMKSRVPAKSCVPMKMRAGRREPPPPNSAQPRSPVRLKVGMRAESTRRLWWELPWTDNSPPVIAARLPAVSTLCRFEARAIPVGR